MTSAAQLNLELSEGYTQWGKVQVTAPWIIWGKHSMENYCLKTNCPAPPLWSVPTLSLDGIEVCINILLILSWPLCRPWPIGGMQWPLWNQLFSWLIASTLEADKGAPWRNVVFNSFMVALSPPHHWFIPRWLWSNATIHSSSSFQNPPHASLSR